jgi:hypothetical protein
MCIKDHSTITCAAHTSRWVCCCAVDTELVLQKVAVVAWALHGVCGLAAAKIASSKGRNPAIAVVKVGASGGSLPCCSMPALTAASTHSFLVWLEAGALLAGHAASSC